MSDKILIIDFDDSFTFNIAEVIFPFCQSLHVEHHSLFFKKTIYDLLKTDEKRAIILGPGPGHPSEYQIYVEQIKSLLAHPKIFVMGICLGHQLLGLCKGMTVKSVSNQLHGITVPYIYNEQIKQVQRYNSLGVFVGDSEQFSLSFERGVSYQFHPESVGTDDPHIYFESLLTFLDLN